MTKTKNRNRDALIESRAHRRRVRRTRNAPINRQASRLDHADIAQLWNPPDDPFSQGAELSYEELLAVSEIIGEAKHPGLSLAEVEAIPFHRAKADEIQECAVCLSFIDLGQYVIDLPCDHKFHSECIRKWLQSRATCPICRIAIPHPEFIIDD